MYASSNPTALLLRNGASGKLSHTVRIIVDGPTTSLIKPCTARLLQRQPAPRRHFSSTAKNQLKEYFPPPANAPNIKLTGPAWHHPV